MRPYLVFALLCFCWGSTFLPAKLALATTPPLLLASLRFLLASTLLFIWLFVSKQKIYAGISLRLLPSSLLTVSLSFSLLFWGIKHLPSGLSGVISFAGVAIALPTLSFLFGQERFSSKKLLGVCLGVVGLFMLMVLRSNAGQLELLGITSIILGACAYAYGSLLAKPLLQRYSAFIISAWQMFFGGLVLLLLSIGIEKNVALANIAPPKIYLSPLYLAIIGSLSGFTSYVYLLGVWPASQVSSYNFICPVIALTLGYFVLYEQIGWLELTASAMMTAAAFLTLKV